MSFDADLFVADDAGLAPIGTAVTWIFCLIVGMVGLIIPYPHARAAAKPVPPVQAQLIHVTLTQTMTPSQSNHAPAHHQVAQPRLAPPAAPPPPAPVAVAAPSAAIAFAVPVKGPVRIVPLSQAVANPAPAAAKPTAPQPQQLTYGKGEGIQPAPEYPLEAIQAHQEGRVVVQFNVDQTGGVTSARVVQPSPYPLLNASALRAIRETWHFPSGPNRSYQVAIVFHINQQ